MDNPSTLWAKLLWQYSLMGHGWRFKTPGLPTCWIFRNLPVKALLKTTHGPGKKKKAKRFYSRNLKLVYFSPLPLQATNLAAPIPWLHQIWNRKQAENCLKNHPTTAAWKRSDPTKSAFAGDDWQSCHALPCKDVGKVADSADLPKPTDTETPGPVDLSLQRKSVSSGSSNGASLKSSFVANVKRGEALLWAITTLRVAHGIVLSHGRIHGHGG